MAAFPRHHLTTWAAPIGGALAALTATVLFLLLPAATLEDLVWRTGVAGFAPLAAPPLGATARMVLAIVAATLAGAVAWSALFLLAGPGGWLDPRRTAQAEDVDAPTLRRADAHPDAPARRPLSTRDLGAPMPPVAPPAVIQPIPADLDQPIAAFHPAAMRDEPLEPVRPVTALRSPPLTKGERMASVELPRAPSNDAEAPSIEALLRRLELGTRRRAPVR